MSYVKGQAALEFLMTYGWAILVVLSAVGALAYFGVLNPMNFLPDQCLASTGVGCAGKPDIQATYVQALLINSMGYQLTLNQSNVAVQTNIATNPTDVFFCSRATLPSACTNINYVVNDGQEFKVLINDSNTANVFRGSVSINYTDPNTGFVNVITLKLSGKVKR